jgi:single-strand DNA-binding protein
MNSISISGNIGKDSEVRFLPNGDPICSFSVADSMGKDKATIWWNCSLFGKRAEALSQYLVKGQQVTVIGNVTEREWTDKEGGKRKSMDVRVSDVALMGGKREQSASPAPRKEEKPAAAGSGFDDLDDDIPFISASMHYDMTTSKQRRMGRL